MAIPSPVHHLSQTLYKALFNFYNVLLSAPFEVFKIKLF